MCSITKGQTRKIKQVAEPVLALVVFLIWQALKVGCFAFFIGVIFWFCSLIFNIKSLMGFTPWDFGFRVGLLIGVAILLFQFYRFLKSYKKQ
jgi:hypothetical protein